LWQGFWASSCWPGVQGLRVNRLEQSAAAGITIQGKGRLERAIISRDRPQAIKRRVFPSRGAKPDLIRNWGPS
jgi:hypothetical protein